MHISFARPPRVSKRQLLYRSTLMLLITLAVIIALWRPWQARMPNVQATPDSSNTAHNAPIFDKHRYFLTDPASPWVVVNKLHPLVPANYSPAVVDPPVHLSQAAGTENMKVAALMSPALEKLFIGAQVAKVPLSLTSGFRAYDTQVGVYAREVAVGGQQAADEVSARPGYSEHQTGLAADIAPIDNHCALSACFGTTPEGEWVRTNAWRYGFIIRYPADKTSVTGYSYEPWHVRYVGVELAARLHQTGVETLEEFFNLGAASHY